MTNSIPIAPTSAGGPATPPPDQATIRVYREQNEKLKIVASMTRRSIMELTEAVFGEFFDHYDALRGTERAELVGVPPAGPGVAPGTVRPSTTIRVTRALHDKLKLVAALERRSIMDLTETIFAIHLRLFEAMSGQSLDARGVRRTPAEERAG